MTKYKLGDKVRIKNGNRNRVSDLEADLLSCLSDRTISGSHYDKIMNAITTGRVWVITAASPNGYELRIDGTKIDGCWTLEEDDLEPVSEKS